MWPSWILIIKNKVKIKNIKNTTAWTQKKKKK